MYYYLYLCCFYKLSSIQFEWDFNTVQIVNMYAKYYLGKSNKESFDKWKHPLRIFNLVLYLSTMNLLIDIDQKNANLSKYVVLIPKLRLWKILTKNGSYLFKSRQKYDDVICNSLKMILKRVMYFLCGLWYMILLYSCIYQSLFFCW